MKSIKKPGWAPADKKPGLISGGDENCCWPTIPSPLREGTASEIGSGEESCGIPGGGGRDG